MSDTPVRFYPSPYADHLYPECPALRRTVEHPRELWDDDGFDPYDETVCGWCQRVHRARGAK